MSSRASDPVSTQKSLAGCRHLFVLLWYRPRSNRRYPIVGSAADDACAVMFSHFAVSVLAEVWWHRIMLSLGCSMPGVFQRSIRGPATLSAVVAVFLLYCAANEVCASLLAFSTECSCADLPALVVCACACRCVLAAVLYFWTRTYARPLTCSLPLTLLL